jgi:hypothetical protein
MSEGHFAKDTRQHRSRRRLYYRFWVTGEPRRATAFVANLDREVSCSEIPQIHQTGRACSQLSGSSQRDVVGHVEVARGVPSGPVEDENGAGDLRRRCARLPQGAAGSCQRRRTEAGAPPRRRGGADRAEQVGVVIPLAGGLPCRVPRLARCRTWPFFWPVRASSSNQISTGVVSGSPSR